MKLSQDAKNRNLTIGNSDAPKIMEEIRVQATQIHEKTFYLVPSVRNPRLLLVGKIRIEACSEIQDYSNDDSPATQSNDISQKPDLNPQ